MRLRLLSALAGLACVLGAPAAAQAAPYVVTLRDSVDDVDATVGGLRKALAMATPTQSYESALKGFAVDLNPGQLAQLRARPEVAFVEPDVTVTASGMEALADGDSTPAGVRRIGAATTTLAHPAATTAVAVLDTGVDLAHPDLDAVSGTNCVKPGAPAQDDNGHGTNVAGIIGARNNGNGVVGVAPGTRVYAVKVLNNRASGTLSQFLCGINRVAANAAALNLRVANMSIAGVGSDDGNCGNTNGDAEHKAICAAAAAGVTFVVSAGNAGVDFKSTVPAAYPEVRTATAMTDTDGASGALGPASCSRKDLDDRSGSYSNYAGTATYTGPSQAAPRVAGVAALCHGGPGAAGPCADLAPAGVIPRLRGDAS